MSAPDQKLLDYMAAIARSFSTGGEEVRQALRLLKRTSKAKADPTAIQLLALRRYLRLGGKKVHAVWAWTPEEAERQRTSGGAKVLYVEAEKVQSRFARQNPGYSLSVSPLRSLERQILLWSKNNTVRNAGANLLEDMQAELEKPEYPSSPSSKAAGRFAQKLRKSHVTPEPSSAAPGTSDHGQARAVDFVVQRGGTTIATTETGQVWSVWKNQGWEDKLVKACEGTRLIGPLKVPNEPWHWRLG